MQTERRIVARCEDHRELRRPAGEQQVQLRERLGLEQLVQVVDDEQDTRVEHARAATMRSTWPRRRSLARGREPRSARARLRHAARRRPKARTAADRALRARRSPGGSPAHPFGRDPGSEHDGLAAARRRRHQRDAARHARREQFEEPRPRHHERGQADQCGPLGARMPGIVARRRNTAGRLIRRKTEFRRIGRRLLVSSWRRLQRAKAYRLEEAHHVIAHKPARPRCPSGSTPSAPRTCSSGSQTTSPRSPAR